MAILAIDPGITTGWSVVSDDGHELIGTGTFSVDELGPGLDILVRSLHVAGHCLTAIVERFPSMGVGDLAQSLDYVKRTVVYWLAEVYEVPTVYVLPGSWKPSRAGRTKLPRHMAARCPTTHQRDATHIALYYVGIRDTLDDCAD